MLSRLSFTSRATSNLSPHYCLIGVWSKVSLVRDEMGKSRIRCIVQLIISVGIGRGCRSKLIISILQHMRRSTGRGKWDRLPSGHIGTPIIWITGGRTPCESNSGRRWRESLNGNADLPNTQSSFWYDVWSCGVSAQSRWVRLWDQTFEKHDKFE